MRGGGGEGHAGAVPRRAGPERSRGGPGGAGLGRGAGLGDDGGAVAGAGVEAGSLVAEVGARREAAPRERKGEVGPLHLFISQPFTWLVNRSLD
jgi:hypothetical protein